MTPTARSLAHLRKAGALAAVVEKYNPHAKVRQDLFGFCDVIAVEPGQPGVLLVQACMVGDQSKRLAKVRTEPRVRPCLDAQNRVAVFAWAKRGARGKRKLWTLTVTPVRTDDLPFNGAEGPAGTR